MLSRRVGKFGKLLHKTLFSAADDVAACQAYILRFAAQDCVLHPLHQVVGPACPFTIPFVPVDGRPALETEYLHTVIHDLCGFQQRSWLRLASSLYVCYGLLIVYHSVTIMCPPKMVQSYAINTKVT